MAPEHKRLNRYETLKLKDIIESSGKNQIKSIFTERYSELQKTLVENTIEKDKLELKLKEL